MEINTETLTLSCVQFLILEQHTSIFKLFPFFTKT